MTLTLKVFEDESAISAAFMGRQGGQSSGIYTSLNCGLGSDDDAQAVAQNRTYVAGAVGCDDIVSLYQVHGDLCLRVDDSWVNDDNRPKADAFVTDKPGLGLGILTADCAPVLFFANGANGPVIGAAHAGWKGALAGVLGQTVDMMRSYEGVSDVHAVIGPCIAKASYEVSEDFVLPFLQASDSYEVFFASAATQGKLLFDLAGFCAARLAESGVKDVQLTDVDTYANADDYFSYRRTTHAGEPDYGRQLSVIAINS